MEREPTIDEHPLRYSRLRNEIETVLSRRLFEKRIDGYLLEASIELAELVVNGPKPR